MANSFYKGTGYRNTSDQILHDFCDGKHLENETGRKENLPLGTTKYNKKLIEQLNELRRLYARLIMVESCAIEFSEITMDKTYIYGAMRNIFNLAHAQKKTRNWIYILISALKKYQVRHQDVYNAFKADIKSMDERYHRNQNVVNDFFKEYGFQEFVDYIERTKKHTIYEDIEEYVETKVQDLVDYTDEEYTTMRKEYVQHIIELAKSENFDLGTEASDTAKNHYERRQQLSKKIKQEKKEEKRKDMLLYADTLVNQDNQIFMQSLMQARCITPYNLSEKAIYRYMKRLTNLGGCGYYLVTVHGSSIYYVTEKGIESQSHSQIFLTDNRDYLVKLQNELHAKQPNLLYSNILSISLPEIELPKIDKTDAPMMINKMGERICRTLKNISDDSNLLWDNSNLLKVEKRYNGRTIYFTVCYLNDDIYYFNYKTNDLNQRFNIDTNIYEQSINAQTILEKSYAGIICKEFSVIIEGSYYQSIINNIKASILPNVHILPYPQKYKDMLNIGELYCVLVITLKGEAINIATNNNTKRVIGWYKNNQFLSSSPCNYFNTFPDSLNSAINIKNHVEKTMATGIATVCKIDTQGGLHYIC